MLKLVTFTSILLALSQAKHEKVLAQCRTEYGIDENVELHKLTQLTEPMKCFIKCLHEKEGYLGSDGKIMVEKMKADDALIDELRHKSTEIYDCLEKFEGFKKCEGADQVVSCYNA